MSAGRTSWWAKDVAWLRRELIVELGEEFGPAGPLLVDALSGEAKEQRDGGTVRSGFRQLARTCFLPGGADEARRIVEHAAGIGALDDLVVDGDGRRFRCRVSGFKADQQHADAAARQRAWRDRQRNVTERDEASESVTARDDAVPTGQDRTGQERTEERQHLTPLSGGGALGDADAAVEPKPSARVVDPAVVRDLFDYWREKCNHPTAKPTSNRLAKVKARIRDDGFTPDDIRKAIDGAARAAYVDVDTGKRFDDLELICRNGSKVEDFIGRAAGTRPGTDQHALIAALAGRRTA